jgi:hypothetical protein
MPQLVAPCKDKIDEEEEARTKNTIAVMVVTITNFEVKALSGIFLLLMPPNRKLVHILSI